METRNNGGFAWPTNTSTNGWPFPNPNMHPRYSIIRVNGREGANQLKMAPNSEALLLDNTAPRIWYAQTDGAGYLMLLSWKITPEEETQPIDINTIAERLAKLEELYELQSNQSNGRTNKKSKSSKSAANSDSQEFNAANEGN